MTQSGVCVLCHAYRYSLHRDHIVPKFKGGVDDSSNIQLLCANCHEDKSRVDQMGRSFSAETRLRMSIAGGRKEFSLEHRANLSTSNKGRKLSPEHKDKLLTANVGRHPTLETRAKMSESLKATFKKRKQANDQ